jgi:protocatechuate 3,4-dioxygenase beta subunit
MPSGLIVACGATSPLVTPPETSGPFYPLEWNGELDADLTSTDNGATADGSVVDLTLFVTHNDGTTAIHGAEIRLWQACASGRYDHPDDSSNRPLDPDFQYRALVRTGPDGAARVRTIIPGSYAATRTWSRPPHIHLQVLLNGQSILITQLYFAGQQLNKSDQILRQTRHAYGQEAADSLIVTFKEVEDGPPHGVFHIVLGSTPPDESPEANTKRDAVEHGDQSQGQHSTK